MKLISEETTGGEDKVGGESESATFRWVGNFERPKAGEKYTEAVVKKTVYEAELMIPYKVTCTEVLKPASYVTEPDPYTEGSCFQSEMLLPFEASDFKGNVTIMVSLRGDVNELPKLMLEQLGTRLFVERLK